MQIFLFVSLFVSACKIVPSLSLSGLLELQLLQNDHYQLLYNAVLLHKSIEARCVCLAKKIITRMLACDDLTVNDIIVLSLSCFSTFSQCSHWREVVGELKVCC